jgi:hypothetical protein
MLMLRLRCRSYKSWLSTTFREFWGYAWKEKLAGIIVRLEF